LEDGIFVFPAKELKSLVSSFSGEIEFELSEGKDPVLRSGRSKCVLRRVSPDVLARWSMPGEGDFERDYEADALLFADTLKRFVFIPKAESGNYSEGVMFEFKGDEFRIVATDGMRLAYTVEKVEEGVNGQYILTGESVKRLIKVIEGEEEKTLSAKFGKTVVSFTVGSRTFVARTLKYKYPNYEAPLSREYKGEVVVGVKALEEAVTRVTSLSTSTPVYAVYEFEEDGLRVKTGLSEIGEGEELVEVVERSGEFPKRLALTAKHVLDYLKTCPEEETKLKVISPKDQVEFCSPGDDPYRYVAMPYDIGEEGD
jgi:DNA polymerase-3 subunit beta